MTTLNRRVDVLEQVADAVRESERRAAVGAFGDWIEANATPDEEAAWNRSSLNYPFDDETLARIGVPRALADELRVKAGPILPGDEELLDGLFRRVPVEMLDRLNSLSD